MRSSAIRLLIMTRSVLLSRGVRDLLDRYRDISVAGESSDEQEAVRMAQRLRPEVILVCPLRSGDHGAQVIKAMRDACGAKSLGLALHGDWSPVARWLDAGGSGCLSMEDSEREIISAIKHVAGGGVYISPRLRDATVLADTSNRGELSAREQEIVALVARGHTCTEIADQLCISPKTVESHKTHINRKLGLRKRADLVRFAIDHGLMRS